MPTARKRLSCKLFGNEGTGRPEITWSTAVIPRSPRMDIRSPARPGRSRNWFAGQTARAAACEIGVAFDHDDAAGGANPLGDRPSDRPGAAAQLDERSGLSQSMFPMVKRDSQRLLGATLAMAVPCLTNLPRKSAKSFMESLQGMLRRREGSAAETGSRARLQNRSEVRSGGIVLSSSRRKREINRLTSPARSI